MNSQIFQSCYTTLNDFSSVYNGAAIMWYHEKHGYQVSGLLAFSVQLKAQYVSWYQETGSISQTQRKYRSKYCGSCPAGNKITQWVQILQDHGSEEIEIRLGDLRHRFSKNKERLKTLKEDQEGITLSGMWYIYSP